MSDASPDEDESGEHSTWPAFVDLFSATSLLFITFVAVFIYIATAQRGRNSTTRERIIEQLDSVSAKGSLFKIDSSDKQFVRIVLLERATFPLGLYQWESLRPEGKMALTRIGTVLNDTSLSTLYREVRVLGHSDQVPYTAGNLSNWELSASRAAVVARFLVDQVHVDPCKISATGRGPYFPISAADMESNRRIEIQILPRLERTTVAQRDTCNRDGDGGARRVEARRLEGPRQPTKTPASAATSQDSLPAER